MVAQETTSGNATTRHLLAAQRHLLAATEAQVDAVHWREDLALAQQLLELTRWCGRFMVWADDTRRANAAREVRR